MNTLFNVCQNRSTMKVKRIEMSLLTEVMKGLRGVTNKDLKDWEFDKEGAE